MQSLYLTKKLPETGEKVVLFKLPYLWFIVFPQSVLNVTFRKNNKNKLVEK